VPGHSVKVGRQNGLGFQLIAGKAMQLGLSKHHHLGARRPRWDKPAAEGERLKNVAKRAEGV